jgi:hypothetical protein
VTSAARVEAAVPCTCPACEARHRRQVEAAARARRARVALVAEERAKIVAAITELWRGRPRLRGNAALTARRVVRELGLDPARERAVRRLASLIRSGQTRPEEDRDLRQEVMRDERKS